MDTKNSDSDENSHENCDALAKAVNDHKSSPSSSAEKDKIDSLSLMIEKILNGKQQQHQVKIWYYLYFVLNAQFNRGAVMRYAEWIFWIRTSSPEKRASFVWNVLWQDGRVLAFCSPEHGLKVRQGQSKDLKKSRAYPYLRVAAFGSPSILLIETRKYVDNPSDGALFLSAVYDI